MEDIFVYDSRLGIHVPEFNKEWDEYSKENQQKILLNWEKIRGKIPDRIKKLEALINLKQDQLSVEQDFTYSCQLNTEIADLASTINDLWLWFRANQGVSEKMHN